MQVFCIIFWQEIFFSFRRLNKVLASFLFFLIFASIFFLLDYNSSIKSEIVIWLSLLSCLLFSSAEFLKKDFDDGTIEQLLISCENFEIVALAKIVANWLIYCAPIIMASYFLKPDLEFISVIIFGSLIVNFICCFCGSLSILGNSAPMIAIIALPLIIPTLLISQIEFFADYKISLRLLIGLLFFLGSILTFATAKIIKISAE